MLEHLNTAAVAPKRVVVMGAAGFIGGAIAARLAQDGVPVLPLSRADIDLLAPDAAARLAALLRPDDAFVAASAKAPVKNADMLVDNVIMARALVQALAKAPVAHVLNISSDAIYADSDGPLTEASCAAPGSLHGAMHMTREVMFQAEVKAPLAMLRPTLVYGPGDPHNGYGPNRFRRLAARGEEIVLFGNGEERRDHVHIEDVAALAVHMLLRRSVGALNAATGTVISFREIAEMVVRLAASPVAIRPTPRSGPMPHNGYRAFDAASVQRAFPGFAFTPIEDGLRQSLAAD